MKIWAMWFINWFCCAIAGIFVSLCLVALFGAALPTPIMYVFCAAAGWFTSCKILKIFNHLD